MLNMLKGLFDSDAVVQWNSSTSRLKDEKGEQIPREFSVRAAKIGVISNDENLQPPPVGGRRSGLGRPPPILTLSRFTRTLQDWWTKVTKTLNLVRPSTRKFMSYIGGILDEIAMPSQRAYLQSATLKEGWLPMAAAHSGHVLA